MTGRDRRAARAALALGAAAWLAVAAAEPPAPATAAPAPATATPAPATATPAPADGAPAATSSAAGVASDAAGPRRAVEAAIALDASGEHAAAAAALRELVESGWESPELWLAVGHAEYRAGRRGWALHAFEEALRLAPGDPDARANLDLVQAEIAPGPGGAPPLAERVASRFTYRGAAAALGGAWALLWALLAARRRFPARGRAALTAAAAAAALAAAAAGGVVLAQAELARRPAAVVVAPSLAAREAPSSALGVALELREGWRVRVLDGAGGEVRVRLPNGLELWVARSGLAPL